MNDLKDRMMGCFLGLIVSDAFGGNFEFKERDSYQVSKEMVSNDNFKLPAGSFTDDSSMMLCLADSLTQTKEFQWEDQMKRYIRWRMDGYLSVNGKCFDIGRTVSMSITKYLFWKRSGMSSDDKPVLDNDSNFIGISGEMNAGNGSIMRLAPIPLFYIKNLEQAKKFARLSSQVTHANPECIESADLMTEIIVKLLNGKGKESVNCDPLQYRCEKVINIAQGDYKTKSRDEIFTTGYVIHTLEAALWAFHKFNTFEEGALALAAMGGDVDTVLAVYGQIAGAYYSVKGIPSRWIESLQQKKMIEEIMLPFLKLAFENN